MFVSDFFGKPAAGDPDDSDGGALDRENHQHAVEECVELLSTAVAFDRPVIAISSPAPEQCTATTSIPEAAFLEQKEVNGCSCQPGSARCSSRRCGNCVAKGEPYTLRCDCKGTCHNPFNSSPPLPAGLSQQEFDSMPLSEVVKKLSARDIELWVAVHSSLLFYCTQFKLCSPGTPQHERCWYCKKRDQEQERLLKDYDFFPVYTAATADGSAWETLEVRQRMMRDPSTRVQAVQRYLSDSALPSHIIAAAYQAVIQHHASSLNGDLGSAAAVVICLIVAEWDWPILRARYV